MIRKHFCKTCGRRLNRGEKNWCLDCLLKFWKEKSKPPFKEPKNETNKIWKKIDEKISQTPQKIKQKEVSK